MSLEINRILPYSSAINEALHQAMEKDKGVFVLGQGVKSIWYVGGTCEGLIEKFGEERVIDTPVSENAMTGAAVGAALAGMRPVIVHPRVDFMVYAAEPIINEAANWHYMFGGASSVPMVIWGILNRAGEQGAQHSQALHALFAHIPGLKVVMPSTPYDAKGLMVSAIFDNNPVMFIDDRWLYQDEGEVPEEMYSVQIGEGVIRRKGKDITIVGISYMAKEAMKAGELLEKEGIEAEIIDPRTIKPLDIDLIARSVQKTGRLLVADAGWLTYGVSAEIAAQISQMCLKDLKVPVQRIALPDTPAPMSKELEKAYYPNASDIVAVVKKMLQA